MGLKLLWLDLETTGLNPTGGASILEVAAVLEVANQRTVLMNSFVSCALPDLGMWFEEGALAMHARTGLLRERAEADPAPSVRAVEEALYDALAKETGDVILAGNSVHFDRLFLRRYMPSLDKRLHYRHLDVSCLTTFFEENFGWERTKAAKPHRAINDVNHSMATYDRYVANLKQCHGVVAAGYPRGSDGTPLAKPA